MSFTIANFLPFTNQTTGLPNAVRFAYCTIVCVCVCVCVCVYTRGITLSLLLSYLLLRIVATCYLHSVVQKRADIHRGYCLSQQITATSLNCSGGGTLTAVLYYCGQWSIFFINYSLVSNYSLTNKTLKPWRVKTKFQPL